eukprot:scaffold3082_cov119-Isochrysis_galbana.AAC.5
MECKFGSFLATRISRACHSAAGVTATSCRSARPPRCSPQAGSGLPRLRRLSVALPPAGAALRASFVHPAAPVCGRFSAGLAAAAAPPPPTVWRFELTVMANADGTGLDAAPTRFGAAPLSSCRTLHSTAWASVSHLPFAIVSAARAMSAGVSPRLLLAWRSAPLSSSSCTVSPAAGRTDRAAQCSAVKPLLSATARLACGSITWSSSVAECSAAVIIGVQPCRSGQLTSCTGSALCATMIRPISSTTSLS